MDAFIGLAKQGYEAYSESQSTPSQSGGLQYNAPHGGQGGGGPNFNHDEVVKTATENGSGDSSMFSSGLGFLHQNQAEHQKPVDEEHVQSAHNAAYSQGNASSLSAGSMGGAAALQVLKGFTSGGGGGSQSQLISMAMAEASNLFDSSGGAASGSKQDAVNGAAMTVMKLMVQSKLGGGFGGGNSGGMGGMLSLASKFM